MSVCYYSFPGGFTGSLPTAVYCPWGVGPSFFNLFQSLSSLIVLFLVKVLPAVTEEKTSGQPNQACRYSQVSSCCKWELQTLDQDQTLPQLQLTFNYTYCYLNCDAGWCLGYCIEVWAVFKTPRENRHNPHSWKQSWLQTSCQNCGSHKAVGPHP